NDHHADPDHAVDRVRAGHQRGVQGGRHLRYDLEADQHTKHEHRDVGEQYRRHDTVSLECTSSSPVISSSGSSTTEPSWIRYSSNAVTLRAHAEDAARGSCAGRLPAPRTTTPFSVSTRPSGTEPATLPPSGPAARSTTTD